MLLEMNEGEVPHVNSVPVALFEWFAAEAAYFHVAGVDDRPVGFLIGLTPGMPHTSHYYRWFQSRYADFVYIDRIVVGAGSRGRGVGRRLYEHMEEAFRGRRSMLACEVNLVPPNEPSLRFHERLGFRALGTLETEGGAKVVRLLVKALAAPAAGGERAPGGELS